MILGHNERAGGRCRGAVHAFGGIKPELKRHLKSADRKLAAIARQPARKRAVNTFVLSAALATRLGLATIHERSPDATRQELAMHNLWCAAVVCQKD